MDRDGSPSPVDVAQAQVDAYNMHNLDAFVATYSPEAEFRDLAQGQTLNGTAAMRPIWEGRFAAHPETHVEIVNRIVVGEFVVDQEHITGLSDGSTIEAVVMYRVQNGQIVGCWSGY
jgi:hypothetical protein